MRINEDYIDGFKDEDVIHHEIEMVSDNIPADLWYEKCKYDGYSLIIAPTTKFVYGQKRENIEKLIKRIRVILQTMCVKISTTQISAVNPNLVREYLSMGVVEEDPETFDTRYPGEFFIKTAVKLKTENVDKILLMFATLSAFLVANGSNIAMLRFALLNDGKWSSDYELKGFASKVEIPLIVPVDIHALLYGTREAQKSVQREYGKTSTKLSTLT